MVYADVAIDLARLEVWDGGHARWTCSVRGMVEIPHLLESLYSYLRILFARRMMQIWYAWKGNREGPSVISLYIHPQAATHSYIQKTR